MKNEDDFSSTPHLSSSTPVKTEIDLIKTAWKGRKSITWSVAVFAAIGLFVAFASPNVFTASTVMVPQGQSKSSGSGGLGGLAALVGINISDMNSGSQDLSPSLYPDIVNSYPFQKEIIYVPLKWNKIPEPVCLYEYSEKYSKPDALSIVKKYTIELPGLVKSIPGVVLSLFSKRKDNLAVTEGVNDSLFPITTSERILCDALSSDLTLVNKSGYLILTAMGPEPLMTAQLADKAQKLLQKKITEYRTQKALQNLAFIQERYNEKKQDFEAVQDRLARFRDRNLNMASNMAKTEEERLQSEYQLVFSVYIELAKQLEGSKIKIKEETPVFSILQPVSVPIVKTEPKRALILLKFIVLGGAFGLGLVFLASFIKTIREKLKEN